MITAPTGSPVTLTEGQQAPIPTAAPTLRSALMGALMEIAVTLRRFLEDSAALPKEGSSYDR